MASVSHQKPTQTRFKKIHRWLKLRGGREARWPRQPRAAWTSCCRPSRHQERKGLLVASQQTTKGLQQVDRCGPGVEHAQSLPARASLPVQHPRDLCTLGCLHPATRGNKLREPPGPSTQPPWPRGSHSNRRGREAPRASLAPAKSLTTLPRQGEASQPSACRLSGHAGKAHPRQPLVRCGDLC